MGPKPANQPNHLNISVEHKPKHSAKIFRPKIHREKPQKICTIKKNRLILHSQNGNKLFP